MSGKTRLTTFQFSTVLLIALAVLAGDLSFANQAYAESSRSLHSKAEISILSSAITMFKNDTGRYPTTEEGLDALVNKPGDISNWDGPYIRKSKVPHDPWGNKYKYVYPAQYGGKTFDLYSFGKDGTDDAGNKDDITNWKGFDYHAYKMYSPTEKIVALSLVAVLFITGLLFTFRKIKSFKRKA